MYKTATQILTRFLKPSTIYKYGFNWSPMYRRTTAKIISVSDNLHYVKIKMSLNWKNEIMLVLYLEEACLQQQIQFI